MTPPEKPSRLGRGLDALLARPLPKKTAEASANAAASSTIAVEHRAQTETTTPAELSSTSAASTTVRSAPEDDNRPTVGLRSLPLTAIVANPFQPRKEFRPDELADLEASLKNTG